jgi:hypothetical protein
MHDHAAIMQAILQGYGRAIQGHVPETVLDAWGRPHETR